MGLERYPAKRHFERTPAPRGSVARVRPAERLRFVVQKHAASPQHYDLRLEMDGVLKSWMVTKEPAADAAVKRLAVRTEDRPLEHGEYGAGQVEPWDEGTWIPGESPVTAMRRGRLEFELKGRRLKGRWALIRMGNASTRKKDLWLLMKIAGADASR